MILPVTVSTGTENPTYPKVTPKGQASTKSQDFASFVAETRSGSSKLQPSKRVPASTQQAEYHGSQIPKKPQDNAEPSSPLDSNSPNSNEATVFPDQEIILGSHIQVGDDDILPKQLELESLPDRVATRSPGDASLDLNSYLPIDENVEFSEWISHGEDKEIIQSVGESEKEILGIDAAVPRNLLYPSLTTEINESSSVPIRGAEVSSAVPNIGKVLQKTPALQTSESGGRNDPQMSNTMTGNGKNAAGTAELLITARLKADNQMATGGAVNGQNVVDVDKIDTRLLNTPDAIESKADRSDAMKRGASQTDGTRAGAQFSEDATVRSRQPETALQTPNPLTQTKFAEVSFVTRGTGVPTTRLGHGEDGRRLRSEIGGLGNSKDPASVPGHGTPESAGQLQTARAATGPLRAPHASTNTPVLRAPSSTQDSVAVHQNNDGQKPMGKPDTQSVPMPSLPTGAAVPTVANTGGPQSVTGAVNVDVPDHPARTDQPQEGLRNRSLPGVPNTPQRNPFVTVATGDIPDAARGPDPIAQSENAPAHARVTLQGLESVPSTATTAAPQTTVLATPPYAASADPQSLTVQRTVGRGDPRQSDDRRATTALGAAASRAVDTLASAQGQGPQTPPVAASAGFVSNPLEERKVNVFADPEGEHMFGKEADVAMTGTTERSAPSGPTAPTPSVSRPETPQAVVRQIIESMARSSASTWEVQLQPEELGRVRMTMTATEAGMAVTVLADRPETLDLMRRHIDLLEKSLNELGYEETSFTFSERGESDRDDADAQSQSEPPTLVAEADEAARPVTHPDNTGPAQGLDLIL